MITNYKNKLRKICAISTGVYLREPEGNEVCYLQISDVNNEDICAKSKHIAYRPELSGYILKEGDLLMVSKGMAYACKLFEGKEPSIASTSFLVLHVTSPQVMPEYLCWFLNHPNTIRIIRARQEVSGTLMIRKIDIENIEVPIPEIMEQSRIVELAKLSRREGKLMAAIAERKQTLMNQIIYNTL